MAKNKEEHAKHAAEFKFKQIRYMEYVSCDGDLHTSFALIICETCGKVAALPDSNFKLITSEAKEKIIQDLKAKGLELVAELLN